MKNIKVIMFFVLIGLYFTGIFAGSLQQVRTEKQDEMYAYLDGAVSGYNAEVGESIRSVAVDNLKTYAAVLICAFFKIGVLGLGAVMMVKGYTTGFAITAVMRFYGIKGLLFCGANLISAAILIPSLAFFGGFSSYNLLYNRQDKRIFLRQYFIMAVIMALVFFIDSLTRGFLSSAFMKLALSMAKSV